MALAQSTPALQVSPTGRGRAELIAALHASVRGFGTPEQPARLAELAALAEDVTEQGCVVLGLDPYGLFLADVAAGTGARPVVPWLLRLFEEGVRELVLLPGLTREELEDFVRVVAVDPPAGETLVGHAWTRSLRHLRLRVTSLRGLSLQLAGGDQVHLALGEPPDGGVGPAADCDVCRVPDAAVQEPPAHTAALRAAFQSELAPERLLALALDAPEGHTAPVLWAGLDTLLWTGDGQALAERLEQARCRDPDAAAAMAEGLLVPERIGAVAEALEASPEALAAALVPLLPQGGRGVSELVTRLRSATAREALVQAFVAAGIDPVGLHRSRLSGGDLGDALQAVTALAEGASPAALVALGDALSHPVPAVREAALSGLDGRWHESLRVPVGRALRDPTPEVRIGALRALAAAQDPKMVGALLGVADGEAFSRWPADDRAALIRLLAALGGPRVEGWFRALLGRASLLSRKVALDQELAIEALRDAGPGWGPALLADLRGRWNHAPAVRAALRGGP